MSLMLTQRRTHVEILIFLHGHLKHLLFKTFSQVLFLFSNKTIVHSFGCCMQYFFAKLLIQNDHILVQQASVEMPTGYSLIIFVGFPYFA